MDGRPGPKAAGVAKREDSYGRISGPKAGSRASSPGEQAAACDYRKTRALGLARDYQKTRALGRGASRSLRLQKNSCAGPGSAAAKRRSKPVLMVLLQSVLCGSNGAAGSLSFAQKK